MAKQISTEEESNLKRQARRRLIGAVVLVLVVVLVLPMVFDSDPSPTTAKDIELRIPDKDAVAPLPGQAPIAPISDVAATSAVAVAPVSAVSVAMPAPVVKAAPTEIKPKAEVHPKVEAKPKAETKPKVDNTAHAKPIPHTGWGVQIGAYSNADTAKQLQAKLSKQGYSAYTEKAGSNLRVRVGSYPTREAAEKAKHKLEASGLQPNVVSLE